MKKELCQREEKGVLFTPDLFDVSEIKWAGRSRKRILVSVACAVVFTVIVVIFAVSFFGKSSGVMLSCSRRSLRKKPRKSTLRLKRTTSAGWISSRLWAR